MPGVFTSMSPASGQVDGAAANASPATMSDKIPYNVAAIIVVSAAVLIALDVLNFRFSVGV